MSDNQPPPETRLPEHMRALEAELVSRLRNSEAIARGTEARFARNTESPSGATIESPIPGQAVDLGLPASIERRPHPAGVELVRSWFGWKALLAAGFAALWDLNLAMYVVLAAQAGALSAVLATVFIRLVIGIGLTYLAIAAWVNRTHVLLGRRKISIRHAPLPWVGEQEIGARNLKQLFSRQALKRGWRRVTLNYEVFAITRDGRTIKVLGGLETPEQALYIEQEIESHLGIEDMPVRGELGR